MSRQENDPSEQKELHSRRISQIDEQIRELQQQQLQLQKKLFMKQGDVRTKNQQWMEQQNQKNTVNVQNIQRDAKQEQMEVQKSIVGLPPFAQLCVQIILKIASFSKRHELEKSSLVDQICAMIQQFEKKYINNKNKEEVMEEQKENYMNKLKEKVDRLKYLFIGGIARKKYFCQGRMKQAIVRNTKKIVFNPTHLVTGQIIRLLVYKQLTNYNISFGHHGIAKTFSYYLYHELSNIFITETLECSQQVQKFLQQRKVLRIPKLIYWSMQQVTDKIDTQKFKNQLKKMIKAQCPEIPDREIENINADYRDYIKSICNYYKSKGVQVIMLIDQINKVASTFRIFQSHKQNLISNQKEISQQSKKLNQKINAQYLATDDINNIRVGLVQCDFNYIIYNSSMNCEYFFAQTDTPHMKIESKSFQKAVQKLLLRPDIKQESLISQHRILYPQIINLDSSILQLADIIIFEIKKTSGKLISKKQREYIFQSLKKKKIWAGITFLQIRINIFKSQNQLKNQDISTLLGSILQKIDASCQNSLKGILINFQDKMKQQKNNHCLYLKALRIIYDKMDNISQSLKKKKRQSFSREVMQYLSFLYHPINCGEAKINAGLFLFLDKNLFQYIQKGEGIYDFMYQIKNYIVNNLKNWGLKIDNKEQKNFQTMFNKKYKELEKINMIVFTFLPPTLMKQLIQPKLSLLTQLNISQKKQLYQIFTTDHLGKAFQSFLIQYIKKERKIEFKTNNFCVQFNGVVTNQKYKQKQIEMKELPKIKKLQQWLKNLKKLVLKQKEKKNKGNTKNKKELYQNKLKQFMNKEAKIKLKFECLSNDKQKQYKQFINQFLNPQKQAGCYLFVPKNQTSKSIDFAIQRRKFHLQKNDLEIYLFQVTFNANITKISQKIHNFIEGYIYAIDYLLQATKQLRVLSKLNITINYVLVGANINEVIMKKSVEQQNYSDLFKYVQDRHKAQNIRLNKIMWVNFHQMDLPNIGMHIDLSAIRQVVEKLQIQKQKQNYEQVELVEQELNSGQDDEESDSDVD